MASRRLLMVFVIIAAVSGLVRAQTRLTVIHTNDIHSHLLGFSPNQDYTPLTTDDDATRGGAARLAALIARIRAERDNPVLVLDGGDFLMGSLFHTISREHAVELALMGQMGYDAAAIGNHEFDLKPDGLARIVRAASGLPRRPALLLANAIFDPMDPRDDTLAQVFAEGLIQPYTVLERGGVKIGLFGLLGHNAQELAPFAKPVRFAPAIETARTMVEKLRGELGCDYVICLSHSGVWPDPAKSEDQNLAAQVPGIDLIVSGHTHTLLEQPLVTGSTLIVQAGRYARQAGVLDVDLADGKFRPLNYTMTPLDDKIAGDKGIQAQVEDSKKLVESEFLASAGLGFDQVVARTGADLYNLPEETGIGNLAADSLRWAVEQAAKHGGDPRPVDLAIQSGGVLRAGIMRGKTGQLSVSDLFRILPLGIGADNTMGYPVVSVYLLGSEIKKAAEVITSIAPLKGDVYWLHLSGIRIKYNPRRMLFDRVAAIEIQGPDGAYAPLDYSRSNKKLYRVVSNIYNAAFLNLIGGFTYHILEIVPKNHAGAPIAGLNEAIVHTQDSLGQRAELKDWQALIAYIRQFPPGPDGLPLVPAMYYQPAGRVTSEPSWNPIKLISGGNYVTYASLGLAVLALAMLAGLTWIAYKIIRRIIG